MKEIIEQSGKTLKEFSEFYGIPYNTIRQWYNGTRQAPPWVKNLIEKAANGVQINMFEKIYYFQVYDTKLKRPLREYLCKSEEQRERLIRVNDSVTKNTIIIKKELIEIN